MCGLALLALAGPVGCFGLIAFAADQRTDISDDATPRPYRHTASVPPKAAAAAAAAQTSGSGRYTFVSSAQTLSVHSPPPANSRFAAVIAA